MINLFIPNKNNNYHPLLLRKWMITIYLVFLILFNFIFSGIGLVITNAAIDFSTLYQLHNEERYKRSLPSLAINTLLINSATAKAQAMLDANCWAHYCPDGKSPWDFFDQSGYYYLYAGENLAEGFVDNQAVMSAWMNSQTHRENIMNTNFTEIGIGFATGNYQGIENNTVIVVHFGTRLALTENTFIPSVTPISNPEAHELSITSPQNGANFNSEDFQITGEFKALDEIQFKANDLKLGTIQVNGNNFTYRNTFKPMSEGDYVLTAEGLESGARVTGSNLVNIRIDKSPPVLSLEKLSAMETKQNDEIVYVLTIADLDASSVSIKNLVKDFQHSGRDNWQINLSKTEIDSQSSLVLQADDLAGNQSKLEVPSVSIVSLSSGANVLASNSPGIELFRLVLPQTPKAQINFSFAIFLSALFGIDYFVLAKTGMTNVKRSKSHLNFTILILTVLLFISSNSLGNILNGIATK